MPYKSTDSAVQNSEYYGQYKEQELQRKRLEVLKKKTQYLTDPNFSETITRDSRGFLVSFPNPLDYGKDDAEKYELITIPLERRVFQQKFSNKLNTEFELF